ncbi:TetR/AcrR family transcriptional regulator [Amycolatopsis benzoatilytica]|uniref:TetR/AcrR family transcriptional regulator n=1 Tax=Amycolatopsis benzoatilytica TaxID=346045 RepID=UPI000382189E|nr:TetR/AcrR family transcriptional regulator [Amycolatopsis benzoatilytica]
MAPDDRTPGRTLLRRPERRSQLIRAATEAFARNGFAATSLDDIAEQAGVTKVLIYRHFASKNELYLAALTDVRDRVRAVVGSADSYTGDTVHAFVTAADEDPDGFRLLFQHAAREAAFSAYAADLFSDAAHIAETYLRDRVPQRARRRWVATLIPKIIVEITLSWLEEGRPVPVADLGSTVRAALAALVEVRAP